MLISNKMSIKETPEVLGGRSVSLLYIVYCIMTIVYSPSFPLVL